MWFSLMNPSFSPKGSRFKLYYYIMWKMTQAWVGIHTHNIYFFLFVDIFHRLSELPKKIFPLWIYLVDI